MFTSMRHFPLIVLACLAMLHAQEARPDPPGQFARVKADLLPSFSSGKEIKSDTSPRGRRSPIPEENAATRQSPFAFTVALTCCVSPAPAPETVSVPTPAGFPQGSTFLRDLVYRRPDAETALSLDVAVPAGKGPFPVVIFLHGGGWVTGTRRTYHPYLARPVSAGYVAVTADYRLAPKHRFPAALHDVKALVRWLRGHAEQLRIDPQRIAVVGYSAGGSLACMLGFTEGDRFLEGEGEFDQLSSQVQAVISHYGISDLAEMHLACQDGQLQFQESMRMLYALHSYLGGSVDQARDRYAQASPIRYVRAGVAPTMLIHGTRDRQVPLTQSERLEARLRQAGAKVELLRVEGADHNFEGELEREPADQMMRFLDRQLKAR